jgi:hypothetical protein
MEFESACELFEKETTRDMMDYVDQEILDKMLIMQLDIAKIKKDFPNGWVKLEKLGFFKEIKVV